MLRERGDLNEIYKGQCENVEKMWSSKNVLIHN